MIRKRCLLVLSLVLGLVACVSETDDPPVSVSQDSTPGTVLKSATFSSSENCPAGGVRIDIGLDDNGNGVLDEAEIQQSQELCHGTDGEDGADGENGVSYLINTSVEVEGESTNCAFGGIRIETGPDINGDGLIDEVMQVRFVCNGADGQDSEDAGLNSLVVTSNETAGANCANGGIRIDSGVDSNSNGVLDGDEANAPVYVCSVSGTAGATSLVELTAEPPGANCAYGGSRIDSGLDANSNDVLDNGEIEYTQYICETQACTWSDNGDGTTTVSCENGESHLVLNPSALDYTEMISCSVAIAEPGDGGGSIPMIYTIDKISDQLRYVTLTVADGQSQYINSRLLTSTHTEFEFNIIRLFFDNYLNDNGGRYYAALNETPNVVEIYYRDSDIENETNSVGQAFRAFENSDGPGACTRLTAE